MLEVFATIPEFPNYLVSDRGNVERADGVKMTASKPRNRREYPSVYLRNGQDRKRVSVHRLVALVWIGPPPFCGAQVRHMDGNHLNNSVENLAWGSARDNAADRDRHGTTARGARPNRRGKATGPANGNYRVTPEMKAEALRLIDGGQSQRNAARELGISQKSVWAALRARAQSQGDA